MRSRQVRWSCSTREEAKDMKEDVVMVGGVLIAAVICAWYVANAVAGVVHPIPTDDTCSTITQCLATVMG
jgi:hypothetical protein